ncbi:VOC family protein [Aureimonas sp. AU12]|uniref:VOC family protein n=1 Tax=Aureimonas sp. AU12 TaxID=1638161 RepID=UPI000786322F|nr:VOC family protein [Aureimonas sp. AU12]
MLKYQTSSAIVAVSDLDRARRFYRDMLGLEVVEDDGEMVIVLRTGATHLVIYVSAEAGTNRANAAVWTVGEGIEAIVADLKAKGVAFEHYHDMEGLMLDGDIHRAGDLKLVWLKDPDGNIPHLNTMPAAA